MSKKKRKNRKNKKSKKKLNKVPINGDFTDVLFEDPVVSDKLDRLYLMLKNTEKGNRLFKEIEDKLDECTKSNETDSYGFYIYSKNLVTINIDEAVPNFDKLANWSQIGGDFPPAVYIILLFREYHKKLINKNFPKYSLLYASVGCIGERFIRALVDGLRDRQDEYIDEGLEKLDWSQLKDRFLKAIMYKEKSAAFKLLGRLSNLDPGESYYFEALAHYNNEEYEDAIRFAKKVLPDNIDYFNAVALILKSYVLKGQFDDFINYLFKEMKIKINKYYYLYLVQILILNSKNLEQDLKKLEEKFKDYSPDESIGNTSEHMISKRELFRNACKLALERMELLDEIDLYSKKSEGEYEIPDELAYRLMQVNTALNVAPELKEHLGREGMTKDELSKQILIMLLNNYKPEFEDYYLAFTTQLRLNVKEHFVKNITSNKERLLLYRDERIWELIEAAYGESIIIGDNESQLDLYQFLKSAGKLDNKRIEEYVTKNRIKNNLCKAGKIAYESAEWQYEKAITEDYGWKDAGLISLAYFRIIEVELNEKIIKPAVNLIGASKIRNIYMETIERNEGKERRDIERKWSSLVYSFENIEKGELQGLTLEGIERLLGMIKSKSLKKSNPDYNLRKLMYDNIIQLVTNPEGVEAIDQGKICELIRYEYRDKYRNPPAHTRYLHIDVAKECKQFVETSLLQLYLWI